ncbi:MAG: EamA family transporter [Gammaproteobacteria bacterium]
MSSRYGILMAFALVNAVWGTTFLAIRVGVQDLPPGLFGGVRFLLGGLIMIVVARLLKQSLPRTWADWKVILITGFLMVVGGNGLVTWAEQWLPSNQAALLVTASALWMALLGTLGPKGVALTPRVIFGLALGFAGTTVMFWPESGFSSEYLWAQLAALGSSFLWSVAAIYLRNAELETREIPFAAAQMLSGGLMMCVIGVLAGELPRWEMTTNGALSLSYLVVMGSCIAYSAYLWMIPRAAPATLGTIAYIVPVIATFAGWGLLGERLSGAQFFGMAVIVVGVAIVTWPERRDALTGG